MGTMAPLDEPGRLQLESTGEPTPVARDAPAEGIVSPFEVSVKSGVVENSSLTPISTRRGSPDVGDQLKGDLSARKVPKAV